MQIDESDEQSQKAHCAISDSLESDSKLTVQSFRHRRKLDSRIALTDEGMQIDASEQFRNARVPIIESCEPD
jgi:hypothetical protein